MSSISGGSSHSNHYFSRARHLNQNNQANDATASADVTDTTQADAINPDATLPELVSMYDQVTQRIQSNDYAPPLSTNNSMGMSRMGLLGRLIPFGMARRSAADLPDGNPWKNILGDRDNAAADAAQPQSQKADDLALQQDLLTMILSRISGMMPADGTATDTNQSNIAVGDTTTDATDSTSDTTVDTSVDTTTDTTNETADLAIKTETAAINEDTTG